jgi:hypothetical protein
MMAMEIWRERASERTDGRIHMGVPGNLSNKRKLKLKAPTVALAWERAPGDKTAFDTR